MPRTVTKRCFSCKKLLPGILRRRWLETTIGWLCDECVAGLPKNKIGEPVFPYIHDVRRCPTYYDGCNCIQAASDAR